MEGDRNDGRTIKLLTCKNNKEERRTVDKD
jgi:hypothetical protein